MRVGVCQSPILFSEEDVLALARNAAQDISACSPGCPPDIGETPSPPLFLLPELLFGGFDYTHRRQWAERSEKLLPRLHSQCQELGIALAGTFWEEADKGLFNSMYLLDPARENPFRAYAKRHLFPLSEEDEHFTPGHKPPEIIDYHGLRLGFAICFELRFPEHFRILAAQDADLIAVSSQWPLVRGGHLSILCPARAVENQCFLLSVNGCGPSPYGDLAGNSRLDSPVGKNLFALGQSPESACIALPMGHLDKARSRFDTRRSPVYGVASL